MRSALELRPESLESSRIRRYLEAEPYRGLYLTDDEQQLFFFEEVEAQADAEHVSSTLILKCVRRIAGGIPDENRYVQAFDFAGATAVSSLNFLSKSASILDYLAAEEQLLILMDEANEEKYNLYLIDLKTGAARALTKMTQALMARVTHDRKSVWFASREPKGDGTFISTLCKVDLVSAVVTRIFNDELDEYKLNFVAPMEFSPDRIFIFMDKGARRHEFQLFEVNLLTGERKACLEEEWAGHRNYMASDEANGEEIFFISMKTGFENLYAFNVLTRDVRTLTSADAKNAVGIKGLQDGCETFIYQIFDRHPSRDSEVILSDLEGREFSRETLVGGATAFGSHKCSLWLFRSTMVQTPRLEKMHGARKKHVDPEHLTDILVIDYLKLRDERERADFVHGTREIVSYRSFDGLEIPALVFLPKRPVRGAVVIAFYGGQDYYAPRYQMYLEQGIAILSPAVRGSWGWGQDWENKLKNDLGGGEILDVIWGARFIAKVLGLPENKVGVEGGSHGGYSVLRAVTMPKQFHGVDTHFAFGFGICWAGFADLVEFHRSSWISDWLVDLLGPFPQNEKLYQERSPVNFVDELRSPLFISHGRNDRRVPISTMTAFLEKLPFTPFEHKVLIQEGEGHKAGGVAKDSAAIEAEFAFIERILVSGPSAHSEIPSRDMLSNEL